MDFKKRQIKFALEAYITKPIKAFVAAKAEELVTKRLFDNDNIQVGNNTMLHWRWIEKGVCRISDLLHEHEAFCALRSLIWNVVVTYNGCVQAVKKYIKGLNIAVQSNNSLNMRKSLRIISKVQKGIKSY